MKKLLLFFFFALFVNSCSKSDSGSAENQLDGYKTVTVTEYSWKFGEKSSYGDLYEQFRYDDNGRLISKETNYKNNLVGRIPHLYSYSYNEKGCLVEQVESGLSWYKYKYTSNDIDSVATMQKYGKDGKLDEEWEYSYDNHRRLLQAKQVYAIGICYVDDYSYSGNETRVVRHRLDNAELFGTTIYQYDAQNNLIRKIWISGETGKEDLEIHNEYVYNASGKIQRKIIHEYLFPENVTYLDYSYNQDGSIKSIHVSYSWKNDQFDRDYEYEYK